MIKPLQIVHLEDNLMDAALLEALLETEGIPCKITLVSERNDYRAALAQEKLDLILSDFSMPAFDGLSALEMARKQRPEVPFIFLSNTIGEELAVDALKEGATDYVLKDRMSRLPAAIHRAMREAEESRQRRRMEDQLAHERDLLRALLDSLPDQIYFKDRDSRFIKCSQKLVERFGLKHTDEVVGKTDFDLFDEKHARPAFEDEQKIIRTGLPLIGKVEQEVSKAGRQTWALTTKMPLCNEAGDIIGTFGISKDITPIKEAEAELEQTHKQLLETSRLAGMAEVATSVLHNVGNVLNSVNVSSSVVSDKVRQLKILGVAKAAALLQEHGRDLPAFFAQDTRARQLPAYLSGLAEHLAREQKEVLGELTLLNSNIDHIKEIVATQQSYSKVAGVQELLDAGELVEDALRMNSAAMTRHQVAVAREFSPVPRIQVERHKVLQILVNLLRNAKHACEETGRDGRQITVRIAPDGADAITISVDDNGIGIPSENLSRIFNHGFTTKKDGHGFGLHSGALAARDLGGSLTAESAGTGHGACFTLRLPVEVPHPVL